MEAMPLTAADVGAVMGNNRDGYGYGDGCWFWILILLFAFWGNNGWGNRNNGLETDIDTRFLERDIFNTNQNVSTSACQTQRDVLETKYDLGTKVLENRFNCSQNACNTQKEVLQNSYDNALQTQTLSAQMAQCCCDLKTAIHAEGESTRALITENTIQDLRDKLTNANNALTSQTIANDVIGAVRPYPVPAYAVSSPYGTISYPYGYYGVSGVV